MRSQICIAFPPTRTNRNLILRGFLVLTFAFGLTGCKTVRLIPESTSALGFDFRPYSAAGFLFTTDAEYKGDYESIGVFVITHYPEARLVSDEEGRKRPYWVVDKINSDSVLQDVHTYLTDMGADALIDFRYEFVEKEEDVGRDAKMPVTGLSITGMAIRRK